MYTLTALNPETGETVDLGTYNTEEEAESSRISWCNG